MWFGCISNNMQRQLYTDFHLLQKLNVYKVTLGMIMMSIGSHRGRPPVWNDTMRVCQCLVVFVGGEQATSARG